MDGRIEGEMKGVLKWEKGREEDGRKEKDGRREEERGEWGVEKEGERGRGKGRGIYIYIREYGSTLYIGIAMVFCGTL